jgi:ubiquitin C-terminal hydrolase
MNQIKKLKDRKRGFSGLENNNNTCYLNCIIQSLANNYKFTCYIRQQKTIDLPNFSNGDGDSDNEDFNYESINEIENKKVLLNFIKLISAMLKGNYIIKPTSFYKSFIEKFPQYKVNYQHDAREFLFNLLEELNVSIQQKCIGIETSNYANKHYLEALKEWRCYFENKKSYIIDNFYGQYFKKLICTQCNTQTYKYDPFLTIHIQAKPDTIYNLINRSLLLDYINKECDKCCEDNNDIENLPDYIKSPEHSVDTLLYKLPQTLIISVDCFTNTNQKINTQIKIDETIDLYEKIISNTDEPSTYKLSSIIYHQGDMNSGHYFCVTLRETGGYTLFNDTKVDKNIDIKKIKSTPYLIFYEKVNVK